MKVPDPEGLTPLLRAAQPHHRSHDHREEDDQQHHEGDMGHELQRRHLVLADLRRRGFSVPQLRRLLTALRDEFGVRPDGRVDCGLVRRAALVVRLHRLRPRAGDL